MSGARPLHTDPGRPPFPFRARRGTRPPLPSGLRRAWGEALVRWGAPAAVGEALEKLTDPDCIVVVTGQQPGVWGGPLYSTYKAATAIAFAERFARDTGRPAVAVFWIGADDADWDEVGWGALPRPDLGLVRVRIPAPIESRRWVGQALFPPPAEATELARAWGRDPAPFREMEPRDFGDRFAGDLVRRFGDRGLLPLDARWTALRAAGAPLWRAYLEERDRIAADVLRDGARLAADSEEAPIGEATARTGLFLLDGDRRLALDADAFAAEAAGRAREGRWETMAPSVLLRAPLQDALLAPEAHVVGPGEAAYLAQLDSVYARLGVQPSARVDRLRAIAVPTGLVDRDGLLADPAAWLEARAAAHRPRAALDRLDALRAIVRETLSRLPEAVPEGDADLEPVLDAARGKVDFQLGRVAEVLDRRGRKALFAADPRMRNVTEFLAPGRRPQDRGLSGYALDLWFGARAADRVLEAAAAHANDAISGIRRDHVMEFGDD